MSDTVCRWQQEEYQGDTWESECGLVWSLIADTPKENDMNYCPKCGRPLEQLSADDEKVGGE